MGKLLRTLRARRSGRGPADPYSRREIWRSVGTRSKVLFFSGVFSLFAAIGAISLLLETAPVAPGKVALALTMSGRFAVLWAMTGILRKFWYMPLIGVAEVVGFRAIRLGVGLPSGAGAGGGLGPVMQHQLQVLGMFAIAFVVGGYVLFLVFSIREGTRYFRTQTEIKLAGEIHRTLVPRIHQRVGAFEVFGASIPSGEVGGDLVDVATDGGRWIAYLADVSGHGVQAGVLMAMFKTAVRVRIAAHDGPAAILDQAHQALYPLKTPNMYVTAAFLEAGKNGDVVYSIAGHPSMLHFERRTGAVNEIPSQNLPLGVLPEQEFTEGRLRCDPGDLLVLVTDGLTEVFNTSGDELGMEEVKRALPGNASQPLPRLFDALRDSALAFGKQTDDQTILLLRRDS